MVRAPSLCWILNLSALLKRASISLRCLIVKAVLWDLSSVSPTWFCDNKNRLADSRSSQSENATFPVKVMFIAKEKTSLAGNCVEWQTGKLGAAVADNGSVRVIMAAAAWINSLAVGFMCLITDLIIEIPWM